MGAERGLYALGTFVNEEPPFQLQVPVAAGGEAAERTLPDDAVTGDHDGRRVATAGLPDGDRAGPQRRRDAAVGARLAVGNVGHGRHHVAGERIGDGNVQVELTAVAGFEFPYLSANLGRRRVDERVVEIEFDSLERDVHDCSRDAGRETPTYRFAAVRK